MRGVGSPCWARQPLVGTAAAVEARAAAAAAGKDWAAARAAAAARERAAESLGWGTAAETVVDAEPAVEGVAARTGQSWS